MARQIAGWYDTLVELGYYLAASPHSRWRQREQLKALDDRMLRDIGVSRAEIGRAVSSARKRPVRSLDVGMESAASFAR
jgi:uncharacterized protein YjiS (DUF1127 family)